MGAHWLRDASWLQILAAKASPHTARDLKFLQSALETTPGRPVKALAYCFCGF
jgi:protease-4